jgi:hypothetical protein
MKALQELAGIILAGIVAFFGGIAFLAIVLLLWLFGLASALCLMVSVFGAAMWCFTGSHHAAVIALAYLGYAAIPFVLAFVFHVYRLKLMHPLPKPACFSSAPDISGLRLAREADFNSTL